MSKHLAETAAVRRRHPRSVQEEAVKVDGHGGVATLTAPKTAGTYTLTCDFHANMTGSLTVK